MHTHTHTHTRRQLPTTILTFLREGVRVPLLSAVVAREPVTYGMVRADPRD